MSDDADTPPAPEAAPGSSEVVPKPSPPVLGALAVIGMLTVWRGSLYTFVCDDAFITFRFVRNFLDGNGIVWNRGEYVEGYTNFLWMLEVSALWGIFGWRPESSSVFLGLMFTAATFAVAMAFTWRVLDPVFRVPGTIVAALLLLANRSFAVWSTSGLAQRQHSFLMLSAITLMVWRPRDRRFLVGASVLLGLAELTRPETLLLAPLLFMFWFGDRLVRRELDLVDTAAFGGPYFAMLGLHTAWRLSYYGEWLPNTYYAKVVRPWWDMGTRFLGVATFEHGWLVIMPLALIASIYAIRKRRESAHLLTFWLFLPIALHLARQGGDHFEFRTLDLYWPLFHAGAIEGIGALATLVVLPRSNMQTAQGVAAALAAYTLALVWAPGYWHEISADRAIAENRAYKLTVPIEPSFPAWGNLLVPLPWLVPTYDGWITEMSDHVVGARHREHSSVAALWREGWEPCDPQPGDAPRFPEAAVMQIGAIGITGFFLPDLRILDNNGLTDHVVARTPSVVKDENRRIAHERSAPLWYTAERQAWLHIQRSYPNVQAALRRHQYALEACGGALGIDTDNPAWLEHTFEGYPLHASDSMANRKPTKAVEIANKPHRVVRELGGFEGLSLDEGWVAEGEAFELAQFFPDKRPGPKSGTKHDGWGLVSSNLAKSEDASGTLTSPSFPGGEGLLALLATSSFKADAKIELLGAGDEVVHTFPVGSGRRLKRQAFDLSGVEGPLRLIVRDGGAGWLMLDHVVIVEPGAGAGSAGGSVPIPEGEAVLSAPFDGVLPEGWVVTGEAMEGQPVAKLPNGRRPKGMVGKGHVNTFAPKQQNKRTGRLTSPTFTVAEGAVLAFKIGASDHKRTGLFLFDGDKQVGHWGGQRDNVLRPVTVDLTPWVGRELHIEIRDEQPSWGHTLVDEVFVYQP